MPQPDEEKPVKKPRVLVAPLDWGLGHTTRCIPLIRELLRYNCDVWLAGDDVQEILLKSEFPNLHFLPLAGYRVRYGRGRAGLIGQIILQVPKIISSIKKENRWLKKAVQAHGFDAVISDNRYGLYHPGIQSIFITHQLRIQSSLGKGSENFLQKLNYDYINRFSACWIPDYPGDRNLAGELSHPQKLPAVKTEYIGPLSRFEKMNVGEEKQHLLFIISGPEPQRSIFEKKIFAEIKSYPCHCTVVRGLPSAPAEKQKAGNTIVYNHLPAEELNREIAKSEWVISRCGYSTVMDLVLLRKKMILIPTPGQTEQEFLARHLQEHKIAFCVPEKEFSLEKNFQSASSFPFHFLNEPSRLNEVIGEFVKSFSK